MLHIPPLEKRPMKVWTHANISRCSFLRDSLHLVVSNPTHDAVGHQGSLDETRQHIGRVMLVVGDSGHARVERHHDESELGQGAQEPSSMPSETGLQVKLGEEKKETKCCSAHVYTLKT